MATPSPMPVLPRLSFDEHAYEFIRVSDLSRVFEVRGEFSNDPYLVRRLKLIEDQIIL
jgi:hypothetical protein